MSKQLTKIDALKQGINQMEPQFKRALPPQIKPERFARVLLTAIGQNPALANADRNSFYAACMRSAQDGLLPDNKEAALVTFGTTVTYMPMISGILKKVRNSGELSSITSQIVYKGDEFEYWVDSDGEHLKHKPNLFSERGDAIGVYALAKTKDGSVYIEVMTQDQVMAVKKVAKTKNVWEGAFAHEMWKKSAIRRLSKRLPMSTDLEAVIHRDDDLYDLNKDDEPEKPAEPQSPNRLKTIVKADEVIAEPEETEVVDAPSEGQELPI